MLAAHGTPLVAQRPPAAGDRAPVRLLVTDSASWEADESLDLGALPGRSRARAAEARLVAQQVADLVAAGEFAARDIAVLLRAATDMATYERALQDRGIATLASGGRGFWMRQQIQDLTSYLAALVNPRDEAALLGVLASPLVGISSDALALLAQAATAAGATVFDQLADPPPLPERDAAAIAEFAAAFAAERELAPRLGLGELLERIVERTALRRARSDAARRPTPARERPQADPARRRVRGTPRPRRSRASSSAPTPSSSPRRRASPTLRSISPASTPCG